MPQNFIGCDREQVLLMPPSLQEWLPQDHLAWFVLAAVEEMDLAAFYAVYRGNGVGRPAHDPGRDGGAAVVTRTRAGSARRDASSGPVWRTSLTG
jgi:hypothetical protein